MDVFMKKPQKIEKGFVLVTLHLKMESYLVSFEIF